MQVVSMTWRRITVQFCEEYTIPSRSLGHKTGLTRLIHHHRMVHFQRMVHDERDQGGDTDDSDVIHCMMDDIQK